MRDKRKFTDSGLGARCHVVAPAPRGAPEDPELPRIAFEPSQTLSTINSSATRSTKQ